MKKRMIALILMSLLIIGLLPAGALAEEAAEAAYLAGNPEDVAAVILHTNDVHVAFQDNIGYDGLALYRRELEQQYSHVLLIDAGDAIQGAPIGSISKGAEPIRMMNRLGYDLAVTGNHEYDFGMEGLDDCAEALSCGYTCANFCTSDGAPVFAPWRMLEAGELKLAFIGVVTPTVFTKSSIKDIVDDTGAPMYDFLADTSGDRLAAALQGYIDEARAQGADLVILVSHLGRSDAGEQFNCDAIVGKLTGLDMVIDGHSHETFNRTVTDKNGNELPTAQTGTGLRSIGQLSIYKDGHIEETLVDTVPRSDTLPCVSVIRKGTERFVDPDVKQFLDDIVASYAPMMERRIGEAPCDFLLTDSEGRDMQRAENGLCDLVADAYRVIGKSQIGYLNSASVREELHTGPVTYNSVLSLRPYSNEIVTVKIGGQPLLDALEFGASLLPSYGARFPQVSGIRFCVDLGIESSVRVDENNQFVSVDGPRRVYGVTVDGRPLDPDAEYTLSASTFLLAGGDGYTMFQGLEQISTTMMVDNEVVMRYIEENLGGVIPESYSQAQGRIVQTGEALAAAA